MCLQACTAAAAAGAAYDSPQLQSPTKASNYKVLFIQLVFGSRQCRHTYGYNEVVGTTIYITSMNIWAVDGLCTQTKMTYEILCSFTQWVKAGVSATPQPQLQTVRQRRTRRPWGRRQWDVTCDDSNNTNTSLPSWAQMEARAGLSTFAERMVTQDPTTPQPQPQPETRHARRRWARMQWDVICDDNSSNDTSLPSWADVGAIAWLSTFTQWMESKEQATRYGRTQTRTPWAVTYDSCSNTGLPSWATDPVQANAVQATATQSMKTSPPPVKPAPIPVNIECAMPDFAPSTPASITPTLRKKTSSSSKKTARPQWRV
jgi:hypothetical protein